MLCAPYWQLAISCKHAPATHLMLYENGSSSHLILTRMFLMVAMLTAACITSSQEFHDGGFGDDGGNDDGGNDCGGNDDGGNDDAAGEKVVKG